MNRRGQEEAATRWAGTVLDPAARSASADAAGERMQATWVALELPPAPTVPAGFARRVARAWSAEQERAAAPILAAAWMRAAAAAALLAGIALGTTLSYRTDPMAAVATSTVDEGSWEAALMSEEYLRALAVPETAFAAPETALPVSGDADSAAGDGEREAPAP